MSTLKDRINALGTIRPQLSMVSGGKDYMDVKFIPQTRIRVHSNYLAYEDVQPLITADGAPVLAISPGTWGQLNAAGNRRGSR